MPVSEPMYGGKGGVSESVEQSVSGGGLTERENVSAESANLTGRCFTLHVSRIT